jgi:hypothetical protein
MKTELIVNGQSKFRIIISYNTSEVVAYTAQELQSFLKQITRCELAIANDFELLTDYEIILGSDNKHLELLGWNYSNFGYDGYQIKSSSSHLAIWGHEVRGILYGVYRFLQEYLGCRWYTHDFSVIPKHSQIVLPFIDQSYTPTIEQRYVFFIRDRGDRFFVPPV